MRHDEGRHAPIDRIVDGADEEPARQDPGSLRALVEVIEPLERDARGDREKGISGQLDDFGHQVGADGKLFLRGRDEARPRARGLDETAPRQILSPKPEWPQGFPAQSSERATRTIEASPTTARSD